MGLFSKDVKLDESEIRQKIQQKLGSEISGLAVDADPDGSVKVTGKAKWHATPQKVKDLLDDVKGVKRVDVSGLVVEKQQPAAAAPAATPSARTYTIEKGDTLSAIAQRFYGDANDWRKIHEANKDQINDPDRIMPGQTIKIP